MKKLRFSTLYLFVSLLSFGSFAKNEPVPSDNNDNIDNSIIIERIDNEDIEVSIPSIVFPFSDVDVKLRFKNPQHTRLLFNKNKITFIINGEEKPLNFINGEVSFKKKFDKNKALAIFAEGFSYNHEINVISLWTILSPIVVVLSLIVFLMWRKTK
ncbi:MAG: hypothetical protein Q8L90_16890 [Bacteroidota bacterium]|nr:hypothetical protein [Bacteroidota bacterium]